eukprot:Polyplicarium_translucidae@DN2500_c0_g1_i4.p1
MIQRYSDERYDTAIRRRAWLSGETRLRGSVSPMGERLLRNGCGEAALTLTRVPRAWATLARSALSRSSRHARRIEQFWPNVSSRRCTVAVARCLRRGGGHGSCHEAQRLRVAHREAAVDLLQWREGTALMRLRTADRVASTRIAASSSSAVFDSRTSAMSNALAVHSSSFSETIQRTPHAA